VPARMGVSGHIHRRWSLGVKRRLTNQHQDQRKAESGGEGNSHVRPVNASNAVVILTPLHGHVIDAKHLGTPARPHFVHFVPGLSVSPQPQPSASAPDHDGQFGVSPANHNLLDGLVLSQKMNSTLYRLSQKWLREQNSAQT
jgi:hypothetical protein